MYGFKQEGQEKMSLRVGECTFTRFEGDETMRRKGGANLAKKSKQQCHSSTSVQHAKTLQITRNCLRTKKNFKNQTTPHLFPFTATLWLPPCTLSNVTNLSRTHPFVYPILFVIF